MATPGSNMATPGSKKKSPKVFEGRIVKTNALIESSYGFDVAASRLLALMMSRVNPYGEGFEELTLTVTEIQDKLGLRSQSIYTQLDQMSDYMMGLFIRTPVGHKSYAKITVLQSFQYISAQDAEDGAAKISFVFHDDMKSHLVNIDGKKDYFTSLYLEYFRQLQKRYSYRLYELFKQHNTFRTRKFALADLREKLDLGEKYKTYGLLKLKVLLPAVDDISKNTDLIVMMDEITQGRKVVGVRFTWFENADFLKAVNDDAIEVVSQSVENFDDVASFVKTMHARYEESYHLKFERAFQGLTKKERAAMFEQFEATLLAHGTLSSIFRGRHKGSVQDALTNATIYALFRRTFAKDLLKPKDRNFEDYAKAMGHEVEEKNGGWTLKNPSLFG
jgi:plasmid replication initiation protein